MDKVEKILRGGSSLQRNVILGSNIMCLVGFGLVTATALNGGVEEYAGLALGICGGGSLVAIFTMVYVLYHHRVYRSKLKSKYQALTPQMLVQMGRDLEGYKGAEHLLFGEERMYGRFSVLGKAFTQSFTWIDYDEIVWAYEKRETYALPHYRANPAIKNSLILRDTKGNGYEIDCHKQYYQEELEELRRRGKQCIIGYSREKKMVYKREPQYFYDRYRFQNQKQANR